MDKYFDFEIIQGFPSWHKVDESFNIVPYKDRTKQKDLTFNANISADSEVQKWKKRSKEYWEGRERYWINHYKGLDEENGTNICVNVK